MKNMRFDTLLCAVRKTLWGGGVAAVCGAGVLWVPLSVYAARMPGQGHLVGQGRPLATGWVTTLNGAAGGGSVSWARIASYGRAGQVGFRVFYTNATTPNTDANGHGVAAGIDNRIAISAAPQNLDLGNTGPYIANTRLGANAAAVPGAPLQDNAAINQDIIAPKARAFGNTIYQQHTWMSQVAIGAPNHHNEDGALMGALHIKAIGVSYHAALKKWWANGPIDDVTMVGLTLDAMRANYNGLFGLPGVTDSRYRYEPEASASMFLHPPVVVGGAYRAMPQNEPNAGPVASGSNACQDAFFAPIPSKIVPMTLAYTMRGHVAGIPHTDAI